MAKFAFVVACTKGYEDPCGVLVNSIKRHTPQADIIVLDEATIPVYPKNQLLMNYIYRLQVAGSLEQCDAVCFVDADMFLVRDVSKFFKIADEACIMIGASDCTNQLYTGDHRRLYPGILEQDFYNTKTITSVPVFFKPSAYGFIFKQAYEWGVSHDTTSDLIVLNMLICKYKAVWDEMLVLPAHCWTNIHHSMLKPNTRIRNILGEYVAESGEEVYMIHGRWFDEKWVQGLSETMAAYFSREFSGEGCESLCVNSRLPVWADESISICLSAYRELV